MDSTKKIFSVGLVMSAFLLGIYVCPAQEAPKPQAGATPTLEEISKFLADLETKEMNAELNSWVNPELVEKLSKVMVTDEYIRSLYDEFGKTVVEPPDPEKYKVYGIDNGEESLVKVTRLGKRLHNLIYSLSGEKLQRYGPILAAMRDVLLLDAEHIPLAIKHDNSRDIYWYSLHVEWMKNVEMEYSRLNDVTEPLPKPELPPGEKNFGWMIELSDGTLSAFHTGATALVDGKRVNLSNIRE